MPIIKSAAKRMRQNAKRATINSRYKRDMRVAIKQVETDIAARSKTKASAGLSAAQKAIDKAVKKGIIHKNTAARRKSRLSRAFDAAFPGAQSVANKPAAKKAASATAKKTGSTTPAKKPAAKTPAKKPVTKKKPAAKKA